MEYKRELQELNMGELRKELNLKIETQRTVDQNIVKITGLITSILARVTKPDTT